MQRFSWPGNVRELEHLVERFAVLHERPWIEATDLPERILQDAGEGEMSLVTSILSQKYSEARTAFERQYLEQCLRVSRGNMAAAARQAGLDRSYYFRRARKHSLKPVQFA